MRQENKEIAWNALSYSALIRIYALICQQYLAGTVQRKKDDGWAVDREVISSAMQYINQHFKEELSLDDVADFAGFSRYYFSRSFKSTPGISLRIICARSACRRRRSF